MSLDSLGYLYYLGGDAPSLDDVRAGRGVIKAGMRGAAVEYVQALAGAIADGNFGPGTETAVKKFQIANGLTADGIVGAQTLAALDKMAGGGTKGVERIDISEAEARAPLKASGSTPATASIKVPAAGVLAARLEQPKPAPIGNYVAYGFGAFAVTGLAYLFWKR